MATNAEKLRLEGNEHFKQKRFNNAVKSYSKALELDVTPILLANRSQAYLKINSYEKALADATECLRLDEGHAKALYRRALAAERLSLFNRARDDIQKLVQLDPENKDAPLFLERLSGKVDELEVPLKTLQKAESLQSTAPLQDIPIKAVHDGIANLDKVSLFQAVVLDHSEDIDKETAGDKPNSSHGHEGQGGFSSWIPPAPVTPADFYNAFADLRHSPKDFAVYCMQISPFRFEDIFGGILDFDTLRLLVKGLNQSEVVSEDALQLLLALASVSRFDLCILMVADDIRDDLLNYLEHYPPALSYLVDQVRVQYRCN